MKRILLIVIALAAVICFASCGKEEKPADGTTAQTAAEDIVIASKGNYQYGLNITPDDDYSEIAKRTVDIENRKAGEPDQLVAIKLDWSRDNNK